MICVVVFSEFLAEESQEKFWDFVEVSQDIEENDGKIKPFSLIVFALKVEGDQTRKHVRRDVRTVSQRLFDIKFCWQQVARERQNGYCAL